MTKDLCMQVIGRPDWSSCESLVQDILSSLVDASTLRLYEDLIRLVNDDQIHYVKEINDDRKKGKPSFFRELQALASLGLVNVYFDKQQEIIKVLLFPISNYQDVIANDLLISRMSDSLKQDLMFKYLAPIDLSDCVDVNNQLETWAMHGYSAQSHLDIDQWMNLFEQRYQMHLEMSPEVNQILQAWFSKYEFDLDELLKVLYASCVDLKSHPHIVPILLEGRLEEANFSLKTPKVKFEPNLKDAFLETQPSTQTYNPHSNPQVTIHACEPFDLTDKQLDPETIMNLFVGSGIVIHQSKEIYDDYEHLDSMFSEVINDFNKYDAYTYIANATKMENDLNRCLETHAFIQEARNVYQLPEPYINVLMNFSLIKNGKIVKTYLEKVANTCNAKQFDKIQDVIEHLGKSLNNTKTRRMLKFKKNVVVEPSQIIQPSLISSDHEPEPSGNDADENLQNDIDDWFND